MLVGILGVSSDISAECERIYWYSYTGVLIADSAITVHVPDARSTRGTIYLGSDVLATAEFCGIDSDYFCFLPFFAVPKQFDSSVRKWTLQDTTYEVVRGNVKIQVLGRELEGLYAIKASPNDKNATMKPWEFMYSPRSGLIAFTTSRGTAWLTDEVGFGASEARPASYPEKYRSWNLCPTSDPLAAREPPSAESK